MSLRVFLSWSGARSRSLAQVLREWLPQVVEECVPWMFEIDLPKGVRWSDVIGRTLSEHDVGILCVTPENLKAPWLLFEAGALSKAIDEARVFPVLLGMGTRDIPDGPLAQFQASRLVRQDMLRLTDSLNALQGSAKVPARYLHLAFDQSWPQLEAAVRDIEATIAGPETADAVEHLRFVRGNVSLRRREEELAESNRCFQAASWARLIAMTYRSLSGALPNLAFPHLREAELCVYALPNLLFSYPDLEAMATLELEWVHGLTRTISGMLDDSRCPELTHLDLTLLSLAPVLTGTDFHWNGHDGPAAGRDRLRLHFAIPGMATEDVPTLILSRNSGEAESEPSFEAFKTMVDKLGHSAPRALRFVLKRPGYRRDEVDRFVRSLTRVSNHPRVGPQDRRFAVEIRAEDPAVATDDLDPYSALPRFEALRRSGRSSLRWQRPDDVLTVTDGAEEPAGMASRIRDAHLFACFVLMTHDDDVVLVKFRKGGWDCDLPGGKVSVLDTSEEEAVTREVFEELGLRLHPERLSPPLGFIYDPRSAKESMPVVAQYYQYPLDGSEVAYLFDFARVTTKGHPLIRYPLTDLRERKRSNRLPIEAICHAPLPVVEAVLESRRG